MGHNKEVTSKPHDQALNCNWRKEGECSMEGNCQINNVFYWWDVIQLSPKKIIFDFHMGNGRAVTITINHNLTARDIQVKHISGLF